MVTSLILLTISANPVPPFIAVDGYVYFAKRKGQWQYAAQSFPSLKGPMTLTRLGIGQIGGQLAVQDVRGSTRLEKAKLVGASFAPGVLAFSQKAAVPRPFGTINTERCRDWVTRWLSQGFSIDVPIDILSAYEGDLDGDGKAEQVAWGRIRYTKVKKPPISQALLLRANGKTYPIYAWDPYEAEYSLKAVVDLDGDGHMELITKLQGWGYSRATISSYDHGSYTQIPKKSFFDRTQGK